MKNYIAIVLAAIFFALASYYYIVEEDEKCGSMAMLAFACCAYLIP